MQPGHWQLGKCPIPIETEEGWFLVQHTSDYDEGGTVYWKEYPTEQAQQSYAQRKSMNSGEQMHRSCRMKKLMDSVIVKDVLKRVALNIKKEHIIRRNIRICRRILLL